MLGGSQGKLLSRWGDGLRAPNIRVEENLVRVDAAAALSSCDLPPTGTPSGGRPGAASHALYSAPL